MLRPHVHADHQLRDLARPQIAAGVGDHHVCLEGLVVGIPQNHLRGFQEWLKNTLKPYETI